MIEGTALQEMLRDEASPAGQSRSGETADCPAAEIERLRLANRSGTSAPRHRVRTLGSISIAERYRKDLGELEALTAAAPTRFWARMKCRWP